MSEKLPILYNKKPCYDIVFTQSFDGLWDELQALGCADKRLCIVTDSKVDELYGAAVLNLLDVVIKPVLPCDRVKGFDILVGNLNVGNLFSRLHKLPHSDFSMWGFG